MGNKILRHCKNHHKISNNYIKMIKTSITLDK